MHKNIPFSALILKKDNIPTKLSTWLMKTNIPDVFFLCVCVS